MAVRITHNAVALEVMQRISRTGITPSLQERIGAFAVMWGLFETRLEGAVWALKEENVNGVRPSTDKSQVSDWIDVLAAGHKNLSEDANKVLKQAGHAAEDLMSYRHALFHGYLMAFGKPGEAMFLRNPMWNGEIRKREVGDAHVSDNLLDLALEAAWHLFGVAQTVPKAMTDPKEAMALEAMKDDVRRVRSSASELRHLTAMVNSEKY